LKDPDMFWDFLSLSPESTHQVTILFSDRGIPKSYRHMDGFSSHTFKWVNSEGRAHWVKYHLKTEAGIQNLTAEEAAKILGSDGDHATRDLFETIERGGEAGWKMYVQLMPVEDAARYRFDVFDVTKVWPHRDYPLVPVGRMVLNRNPTNYFAETEQSAFSPSKLVPGIEVSPDKMLQGRLFSYPDTHRHRLGVNYEQLPVNSPYNVASGVNNGQRDGFMAINNQGSAPNYSPNSHGGPVTRPDVKNAPLDVTGVAGKYRYQHPNSDFEQPGNLYRLMTPAEKQRLVSSIAGHMSRVTRKDIKERACINFYKADPDYGTRIAKGVGLDPEKVFARLHNAKL